MYTELKHTITLMASWCLIMVVIGCASDGGDGLTDHPVIETQLAVGFDTQLSNRRTSRAPLPVHVGNDVATRATTPAIVGEMTTTRLQSTGFGAFSQYTEGSQWSAYYGGTVPAFNFMWNEDVLWDGSVWNYSPVKYWPNDNQPADKQDPAAQGSREHSYLQFFAYAPYVGTTALPATGHEDATADGIVEISANSASAKESYVYYRTSLTNPFGVADCVDLLWANQQNRYKTDGAGYVNGHVDLLFKHALSKVSVVVKALVDRTATHTSEAYSTEIDPNTRIYIEDVTINTPDYYSEGKLMIAPNAIVPTWSYDGIDAENKKTAIKYNNITADDIEDVTFGLRYTGQPGTSEADAETERVAFEAMEQGVTTAEQYIGAVNQSLVFPPTTNQRALSVTATYHVITFDPSLTLNEPKFYSYTKNNITASLGNDDFKFEPNKEYKIVLNLGLTSIKFEVYVLDDDGEWILLSAVVKEWDLITKEANVE